MAKLDPETENNIEELIRAAEAGNADAQCDLAWSYDEGEGVEVDHEKAFYWYTQAAEQNDATAQYNLGCCYEDGLGVKKNPVKAFECFQKAAEDDYPEAVYYLGSCIGLARAGKKAQSEE